MQHFPLLVRRYLPAILMIWAFNCFLFLYGYLVGTRHWFPYNALSEARVAARIVRFKLENGDRLRALRQWTNLSPFEGKKRRVVAHESVNDDSHFLLHGGEGQYLEHCPEHGCAAVILRRDGSLVHAYPYRPEELVTKRTMSLPYQQIMHDDAKDTMIFGLAALPHGDLIAIYDYRWTVPQSGGIARIDKDGHVLWYRRDYTDHWPTITDKGEILAVSHTLQAKHIDVTLAPNQTFSFDCPQGVFGDLVRVLDGDGNTKEEIPIFDALRKSAYRSYLIASSDAGSTDKDGCDPVHTNMVTLVGPAMAARLTNVAADDILVSLRNLSAIAIIGRGDHGIKHLFKGPFLYQHSVQPTADGKLILFDNLGASSEGGPSRVLIFDPATGGARTLFPLKTNQDVTILSRRSGNISLSAEGTRALIALATMGRAYEIRLDDGAILTSFDNLHDLHSLPQFARRTTMARFHQNGIYYVPSNLLN